MYLKLKRWLTGFDWLERSQAVISRKSQETPSLDYNDLAFQLASANDMNETLPGILEILQSQLNTLLPKHQAVTLLVQFCRPATSESWLHHAYIDNVPSPLTQTLHHHFTIRKTPEKQVLSLNLDRKLLKLIPVRLFEHEQQHIWLLYLFETKIPGLEQLKWKTAALENTLTKGIKAWCQTESKINTALATERAIYAAELHDSLAQILGFLKIKSAKLDKLCQQPPHQELKSISEELATYTNCAYHQTRELIVSSRLTLQTENLSQAVTNSIHEFEQQSAIVFDLDNRLQSATLSAKQSMQILYIIRESLSNIVRHSHASHASVRLFINREGLLEVEIEDDGTGIDPAVARSDSFGLQIMHERAARIGANLQITDRHSNGTCVTLTLNLGVNQ